MFDEVGQDERRRRNISIKWTTSWYVSKWIRTVSGQRVGIALRDLIPCPMRKLAMQRGAAPTATKKRPRRDLNPCYQDENLVSWTWLDDGVIRSQAFYRKNLREQMPTWQSHADAKSSRAPLLKARM